MSFLHVFFPLSLFNVRVARYAWAVHNSRWYKAGAMISPFNGLED